MVISLNAWPPFGGTVLEGLVDMTLLEEICNWEWALRFQTPRHSYLSIYLFFPIVKRSDVSCELLLHHYACLPTVMLPIMMVMNSISETLSKP